MPTLEAMQRWAEHYAGKLGLVEAVRVVRQEDCPGSTRPFPHCSRDEEDYCESCTREEDAGVRCTQEEPND